jgi:hypothetical protein
MEYEKIHSTKQLLINRASESHLLGEPFLGILSGLFGSSMGDCLSVTKGFQILLQVTADVMDAREQVDGSGLIPTNRSTDEAIGILYATYIFNLYEKEFSPLMGFRILEVYCRETILEIYKFSYKLFLKRSVNIEIDFSKNIIDPVMEIYPMACQVKKLGHKKHWNPFKEPFYSLWNDGFENKDAEGSLIRKGFKIMMAKVLGVKC